MCSSDLRVISNVEPKATLQAMEIHTPDLFITDLKMAQMDGTELARTIRANPRFKNTPILFLSGRDKPEDIVAAMKSGGSDYIVKPPKKSKLLETINALISKRA